jgi:hypothetical protein
MDKRVVEWLKQSDYDMDTAERFLAHRGGGLLTRPLRGPRRR